MKQLRFLLIPLTLLIFVSTLPPAFAGKEAFTEWHINVHFINGSKDVSQAAIRDKVDEWVRVAERIYQRKPKLMIDYEVKQQSTKDGKDLSAMVFDSNSAYASFMDKNFDNVAVTRTEGHLTVLITDKLCIGKYQSGADKGNPKCWGGYAHFPHWVNPFSKKRGI